MDAAHILTNVAVLFLVATLWSDSGEAPAKVPARKAWLTIAALMALASLVLKVIG